MVSRESELDSFLSELDAQTKKSRKQTQGRTGRAKPWILNALHSLQNAQNDIGLAVLNPIEYWSNFLSTVFSFQILHFADVTDEVK